MLFNNNDFLPVLDPCQPKNNYLNCFAFLTLAELLSCFSTSLLIHSCSREPIILTLGLLRGTTKVHFKQCTTRVTTMGVRSLTCILYSLVPAQLVIVGNVFLRSIEFLVLQKMSLQFTMSNYQSACTEHPNIILLVNFVKYNEDL